MRFHLFKVFPWSPELSLFLFLLKFSFSNFRLSAITCDTAPATTGGSNDCSASTAHAGTCTATCDSGFYSATTTYTCGDSDNDGVGDFNTITCAGL